MGNRVIDLHCDSVFSLMEGKDIRESVSGVHVDLPRLRKGGVGLQVFAAYVPPETFSGGAFAYAGERLSAIESFASSSQVTCQVETFAELKEALASGKTGIMAAVENGLAIENSLEKLELLRRRKVRIMTLVHSRHTDWAASCTGTGQFRPEDQSGAGLSGFGGKVVDAMTGLGIIPDLSHSAESTFWDVLRRAKKPVIASHSCAYALCASPRNLKDDQLKALGDSGGLVGINFFSAFLSEPFRLEYAKSVNQTPASIQVNVPMTVIADHIDHITEIAGEDCVALGSDFDGIPAAPLGVTGSDFYPFLEAELKSRGYTEERVKKIFNGNFLRLFEEWN